MIDDAPLYSFVKNSKCREVKNIHEIQIYRKNEPRKKDLKGLLFKEVLIIHEGGEICVNYGSKVRGSSECLESFEKSYKTEIDAFSYPKYDSEGKLIRIGGRGHIADFLLLNLSCEPKNWDGDTIQTYRKLRGAFSESQQEFSCFSEFDLFESHDSLLDMTIKLSGGILKPDLIHAFFAETMF